MFERFNTAARRALVEAPDVAIEVSSTWLTPAHLLCGCAEVGDPTAGTPRGEAQSSAEPADRPAQLEGCSR